MIRLLNVWLLLPYDCILRSLIFDESKSAGPSLLELFEGALGACLRYGNSSSMKLLHKSLMFMAVWTRVGFYVSVISKGWATKYIQ